MRIPIMTVMRWGILAIGVGSGLACGSDTTGPAPQQLTQLYWQVTLNHHAITLATVAPYDTIHLVATPRTVDGTPIPTTAMPVFTTSDTSIVIDSLGMVRVHGTATKTGIVVTARLTAQGITLADTAYVNVVQQSSAADVPVMQSLRLQPVAGDSAIRSAFTVDGTPAAQTFAFPVATTATGDSIPHVAVRYRSANPLTAFFNNPLVGTVTPAVTGRVLLTAEATVYGRRQVDSLWYTVGWPIIDVVQYGGVEASGSCGIPPVGPNVLQHGSELSIGQGGIVLWINSTWGSADDSLDVHFDDSTTVAGLSDSLTLSFDRFGDQITAPPNAGGNIAPFGTIVPQPGIDWCGTSKNGDFYGIDGPDNVRVRTFPRVGTYHWYSVRQGTAGTIHVMANAAVR